MSIFRVSFIFKPCILKQKTLPFGERIWSPSFINLFLISRRGKNQEEHHGLVPDGVGVGNRQSNEEEDDDSASRWKGG